MNNTSQKLRLDSIIAHCVLPQAEGRGEVTPYYVVQTSTFIVSESMPSLEVESIICMCSVSTAGAGSHSEQL